MPNPEKFLTAATLAGLLLATGASGAAVGLPFDHWFYFQTQASNVITWGGFNASTGDFLGEGVCVDPIVPVNDLSVDRDPVTQELYLLGNSGVYRNDFVANRCELDQILATADFPASTVSLRGVSLNDDSTALYVLWFDGDSSAYVVSTVDLSTNMIVESLNLQSDDIIYTDAQLLTYFDGTFYIASSDNRLWEFDMISGNQVAVHAGPIGGETPLGLDRSSDGLLHEVVSLEGQQDVSFTTFNPSSESWSVLVPTTYPRMGYTYIEADPELANTGVDSGGIALAAASLLAVGGAIALRRRARR